MCHRLEYCRSRWKKKHTHNENINRTVTRGFFPSSLHEVEFVRSIFLIARDACIWFNYFYAIRIETCDKQCLLVEHLEIYEHNNNNNETGHTSHRIEWIFVISVFCFFCFDGFFLSSLWIWYYGKMRCTICFAPNNPITANPTLKKEPLNICISFLTIFGDFGVYIDIWHYRVLGVCVCVCASGGKHRKT